MRASYTLGSASRYGSNRVARPTSSTRSPVAKGSSVPPWPILRVPTARRATATASCDVRPAGLSTSSTPSVVLVLVDDRFPVLDLLEERLDARCARDALVEAEGDLGSGAQLQVAADARAEMCGEALEPFEGGFLLGVRAEHAHVDLSLSEVARDLDARDSHERDDARILGPFVEEGGDFYTNRFGDPICPARVFRHAPPRRRRTCDGAITESSSRCRRSGRADCFRQSGRPP